MQNAGRTTQVNVCDSLTSATRQPRVRVLGRMVRQRPAMVGRERGGCGCVCGCLRVWLHLRVWLWLCVWLG